MRKTLLFALVLFSITNLKAQLVSETVIGYTMYDVQYNRSSYNRIVQNPDGTVAAVWTFSPDSNPTFPLRGTGYNYYDGSSWGPWPLTRTETSRTGFTNIINTASGKEISIQHTGFGISANFRATKGSGTWTFSQPWGTSSNDSWAKAACSGDSVYAIWSGGSITAQPVAGQTGPIYFSASYDGGLTWTPKTIIPQLDSSHYAGWYSESYAIDAKGGTVAISYGEMRTDLGILKSTDGGQTWTQIIVNTHPLPHYSGFNTPSDTNQDGINDTINSPSGDQTLLIDNNGMCHVWFSEFRWYSDGTGSSFTFLEPDALNYWNENMGTDNFIKIAGMEDFNGNGRIDFPVNPALCTSTIDNGSYIPNTGKPSAGIDQNGTIYLVYQTIDERSDTTKWSALHTHSYIKTLPQIAGTYDVNNWTYPFSISKSIAQGGNDEFEECVFPAITKSIGQYAYVVYQRDGIPGVRSLSCPARDSLDSYTNEIVVAKIEAATVGIKANYSTGHNGLNVYPNPADRYLEIVVSEYLLNDSHLQVTDVFGELVFQRNLVGERKIKYPTENLAPGIYMLSIISSDNVVSKKFIVQHSGH